MTHFSPLPAQQRWVSAHPDALNQREKIPRAGSKSQRPFSTHRSLFLGAQRGPLPWSRKDAAENLDKELQQQKVEGSQGGEPRTSGYMPPINEAAPGQLAASLPGELPVCQSLSTRQAQTGSSSLGKRMLSREESLGPQHGGEGGAGR